MNFDFSSKENIYLVPPYIDYKERLVEFWKSLKLDHHVFFCSSGTTNTGSVKSYAISKEAILKNAKAVNKFLGAKSEDTWLASLPHYHIGGLSIYARAFLSCSEVISLNEKWSVAASQIEVSYQSMVPSQLYLVVKENLGPPARLKGVFIGGDFLSKTLRDKALALGWPLISTYGMSEVGSQLASKFVDGNFDGFLPILSPHTVDEIGIQSQSMYTYELLWKQTGETSVKQSESVFIPNDYYELSADLKSIKPLGRKGDTLKYKGRLYQFFTILEEFQSITMKLDCYENSAILKGPPTDHGDTLIVQVEDNSKIDDLCQYFQKSAILQYLDLNFQAVTKLKKTELGKIKR